MYAISASRGPHAACRAAVVGRTAGQRRTSDGPPVAPCVWRSCAIDEIREIGDLWASVIPYVGYECSAVL